MPLVYPRFVVAASPAERPSPPVALLSAIKFSHTVFALPFALLAALLAARGIPELRTLAFILLAMVGARSAAMSWNRLVDRDVDAANPRTQNRELVTGVLSVFQMRVFCALSVLLFLFAASQLNRLCLLLAPIALLVVLGYSHTKRFTALAHLVLGLGLAIAPVGAWVAVRGEFALLPVVLGFGVLFWVAGFDVIYSLQDESFDREQGLHSIPSALGGARALLVSRVFHVLAFACFLATWSLSGLGLVFLAGVLVAGGFLVRQQLLVTPTDLSRVDAAFFTANGWLSVVLFAAGAVDLLLVGH